MRSDFTREEKIGWRDINRENTVAGNVGGSSNFLPKWKPSSFGAGWTRRMTKRRSVRGTGQEFTSSRFRMNGFRWKQIYISSAVFFLGALASPVSPILWRSRSLFSRRSHTFSGDGLTLDLSQVETTTRHPRTKNDEWGMQWSEISLTLQPFHYTNGRLNLRCTAQIPGIFSKQSELQLLSSMREPVPERGNYKNSISTLSLKVNFILKNCQF